ncbi:MAG: glycosyltransferase [Bowdeniella nasicola]|nr:glycosyltransferase [Bowdeniella nasicola]
MRIVELSGSSAGGVRAHVADVLAALDDQQIALLAPDAVIDYCQARQPSRLRYERVRVSTTPQLADVATLATITRYAKGADVIHAHTLRAGAYAALALRTLRRRPPLVVTIHNRPTGQSAVVRMGEVLKRLVIAHATKILAVSPDISTWLARDGAKADLAVIPARKLPPARQLPAVQGGPVLVTVARLSHQKGLDLLLDTAATLQREFPQLQWVIVGEGPLRAALETAISRRALPVTLVGQVEDLAGYFFVADLVVQTSRWEGQPVAMQEAIHAGAAIVATDVGGTSHVLGPEIPAVAPADLCDAIAALLRDPKARRARSAAARRRSKTLPTIADLRTQLLTVLGSV